MVRIRWAFYNSDYSLRRFFLPPLVGSNAKFSGGLILGVGGRMLFGN